MISHPASYIACEAPKYITNDLLSELLSKRDFPRILSFSELILLLTYYIDTDKKATVKVTLHARIVIKNLTQTNQSISEFATAIK